MGLFNKKKRELMEDLPPPPPVNDFTDINEETESMELPPMPPVSRVPKNIKFKDLPPMPPPPIFVDDKNVDMPEFPSLDDFDKGMQEESFDDSKKDMPNMKEYEPLDVPEIRFEEENASAMPSVTGDRDFFKEKEETRKTGPVFMKIEDYRGALESIKTIKTRIKDAEESIRKLNEIKESEDRLFEKFRAQLEDLQRKSNYVDKRLFEGKE